MRAAGAPVERVVLTRNRRVMASLGAGGATLRLHHHFAAAPPEVIRALAALLFARRAAARADARSAVRAFLASRPAAPPVVRPRRAVPADEPHLARLRTEFDRVNADFFCGALPAVPVHLSGRMTRRNGHFRAAPPEIVLARRLCSHAEPGEAERTLRHEMIHLWQHTSGGQPGHGPDFRAWARRLGIVPRATRSVCWRD